MKLITKPNHFSAVCRLSLGLMAVTALALAQDQAPHPWRTLNDAPPAADQGAPNHVYSDQNGNNSGPFNQGPAPDQGVAAYPAPADPQGNQSPYNQAPYNQAPPPPPYQNGPQQGQYQNPPNGNYPPPPQIPSRLTIKPGTYVTVRINQLLSSDHNQQGDAFTATLAEPIVVDGIVVAQRGQTVAGHVTEAQKAGRVEGTSRLGVQLTELTLVDGQQEPIQSQMINRNGPTSAGRDAAAIGTTTGLGAIIGAGADWGRGAAIGAGAGAAAGIIGVLLTRGQPTVLHPESVLTFRIEAPVTFSTDRAPQAFRYVENEDYGRQSGPGQRSPAVSCYNCGGPAPVPPPAYGYGYPAYAPYAYGGYGYPYYGGLSLYVGPRYGYFYGGRYRGGYRVYRR